MPNVRSLLGGDPFGSANVDARCRRGPDHSRDDDKGDVQRSRRRELGECTQPPMRQPRRPRRERVEMKHDERSRKGDTEGTWSEASANSSQSEGALPDSRGHRLAPAPRHHGHVGKFPRGFAKSHATSSSRWRHVDARTSYPGLAVRGASGAWHRDGRGAAMARRDNREYRTYLRAEQRRQRGCIARRMQRHLHHGLLVPSNRDDLHKSRSAAPAWQGAKSELIGHK